MSAMPDNFNSSYLIHFSSFWGVLTDFELLLPFIFSIKSDDPN